ncbi:PRC-barrel domain-containing protein [Asanoa sp. WMMD1127]|uniref:PRC-barrel domain-containing protein n=1 Tax=Asanoa sp. WMMD1127 TaxID=3016107 RepID=UPI002417568F|nr:PRC-barrel domain-containing protein [Asanoa sp. WMMD1127]MDG4824960.1 PRC-barrel domain-containing protein [Asanoa sp. WMMD1127]
MTADAMLVTLSDTERTVSAAEDVRGRRMRDCDGLLVGTVTDLLVDTGEGKVRFLRVGDSGAAGPRRLPVCVPVEAVTLVRSDEIQVDQTLTRITGAPRSDAQSGDQLPFYRVLYSYYDYPPFWSPGHVYPPFPQHR